MNDPGPEISDLIVDFDPVTLERLPVKRDEVAQTFETRGNRRAARIVRAMDTLPDGTLDPDAVDALMLRVHSEIQRLSEEFLQGHRALALVRLLINTLRDMGQPGPYRVVDVGCGPGYMLRWLAANANLGDDVQWVGADYHVALIERARLLARAEGLPCQFEVTNAFNMTQPATIYMSVGVIHHFRGAGLESFFAQQNQPGTWAFAHFDILQSWLAPLGAWLFHQSRMREPLARHDGVMSARRAHPSDVLKDAATRAATDMRVSFFDEDRSALPILKVMHAVVGVKPALCDALAQSKDPARLRLEPFS